MYPGAAARGKGSSQNRQKTREIFHHPGRSCTTITTSQKANVNSAISVDKFYIFIRQAAEAAAW